MRARYSIMGRMKALALYVCSKVEELQPRKRPRIMYSRLALMQCRWKKR
jgi:hypothetical protein